MFRRYHNRDITVDILASVTVKAVRFLNHVLHPDIHGIFDHASLIRGCKPDPNIVK